MPVTTISCKSGELSAAGVAAAGAAAPPAPLSTAHAGSFEQNDATVAMSKAERKRIGGITIPF